MTGDLMNPNFDNARAFKEGWGIFTCTGSENGPYQLQRLDEAGVFESDPQAWAYVARRAAEGSAYHQSAIEFLIAHNLQEALAIRRYMRLPLGVRG